MSVHKKEIAKKQNYLTNQVLVHTIKYKNLYTVMNLHDDKIFDILHYTRGGKPFYHYRPHLN